MMVSNRVITHIVTSVPGTSVPGISFSRKRKEIVIFRSSIAALGDPYFIRFLMNMEKGYFALQRCEEKEIESFVVPNFSTLEGAFRIYSENICRIIWQRFGWDKDHTYHCFGTAYPEFHLVEFDLNKAEPISDRPGESDRSVESDRPSDSDESSGGQPGSGSSSGLDTSTGSAGSFDSDSPAAVDSSFG